MRALARRIWGGAMMSAAAKEVDGGCASREDGTHCMCWWDGDSPCCSCGFTEDGRERWTGKPDSSKAKK